MGDVVIRFEVVGCSVTWRLLKRSGLRYALTTIAYSYTEHDIMQNRLDPFSYVSL